MHFEHISDNIKIPSTWLIDIKFMSKYIRFVLNLKHFCNFRFYQLLLWNCQNTQKLCVLTMRKVLQFYSRFKWGQLFCLLLFVTRRGDLNLRKKEIYSEWLKSHKIALNSCCCYFTVFLGVVNSPWPMEGSTEILNYLPPQFLVKVNLFSTATF